MIFGVIFILSFFVYSNSYVFTGIINTDNGYCEYYNGVLIPVNDFAFDAEKCERVECSPGQITRRGCGVMAIPQYPGLKCSLVRGEGITDCCLTIPKCKVIFKLPGNQSYPKNWIIEDDGTAFYLTTSTTENYDTKKYFTKENAVERNTTEEKVSEKSTTEEKVIEKSTTEEKVIEKNATEEKVIEKNTTEEKVIVKNATEEKVIEKNPTKENDTNENSTKETVDSLLKEINRQARHYTLS